ncbi:alpha/beta fold hydrolase [Aestuariivita sp.]|jgi:pimeloyl-ACP methyl ester carboxylesterase|uniref:alpha/beta fold hydrolase n=1 Tax=Aestuariivita sp. TaxID=1872407 RepID=UPI0025BF5911|nr:alpha/beta fold hydrolase [Aestuariivita sp.]
MVHADEQLNVPSLKSDRDGGIVRKATRGNIEIATSETGDSNAEAIVLSMGATASMEWWPPAFVEALAGAGYRVICYDHRDTGQSSTNPPGTVEYSVDDLCDDLVSILDEYEIASAHLLGMSLGGLVSQMLAVKQPDRVRSLTLLASEPLNGEEASAVPIDQRFLDHFKTLSKLDWSRQQEVVDFMLGTARLSAGSGHPFDEKAALERIKRELERAKNIQSAFNHSMMDGEIHKRWDARNIEVRTLIIHGTDDPIISLQSAKALARQIPGAELLVLDGVGHELPAAELPRIEAAIVRFLTNMDT